MNLPVMLASATTGAVMLFPPAYLHIAKKKRDFVGKLYLADAILFLIAIFALICFSYPFVMVLVTLSFASFILYCISLPVPRRHGTTIKIYEEIGLSRKARAAIISMFIAVVSALVIFVVFKETMVIFLYDGISIQMEAIMVFMLFLYVNGLLITVYFKPRNATPLASIIVALIIIYVACYFIIPPVMIRGAAWEFETIGEVYTSILQQPAVGLTMGLSLFGCLVKSIGTRDVQPIGNVLAIYVPSLIWVMYFLKILEPDPLLYEAFFDEAIGWYYYICSLATVQIGIIAIFVVVTMVPMQAGRLF